MTEFDLSSLEFEKYTWDVIQSYFDDSQSKCLIKHQIESYNDFVLNKLEQIIEGFNDLQIHHKYIPELDDFKYTICINVSKPVMTRPTVYEKDGSTRIMTPTDARQRNFSYSSNVYVEFKIHIKWYDNENNKKECRKIMKNVNIGKVPIMVGSNYCILENPFFKINSQECKYDYGGYFIINGNEKVVISHDRIAENKTYVFLDNKLSQYSHIAEIRSVPDNVFGPPKLTSLKLSSKQTQFGHYVRMNIHHIRIDIPIFILFRALGFESDKDIVKLCVYDIEDPNNKILIDNLKGSIEDSNTVLTRLSALDYLQKFLNISGFPKEIMQNKSKRINIILDILKNDFLPHVGEDRFKKALYLGYMVNKLMKCFLGIHPMDDRDSYLNKRVDTPGIMVANLFRQYYGKVVKDVKNMIYKELNNGSWKVTNDLVNLINKSNIYKIVKPSTIESGLKYGLATGNWGIKNTNAKQGVAQVLNRLTYNATISHLRRVNTPMEKSGKLIQPRKLHNTQWGIICPSETPEGSSVGLVKNISIMSTITIASNSTSIYTYLKEFGVTDIGFDQIQELNKNTWIFVNGNIVGIHKNPKYVYGNMLAYKRKGIINIYTSISWDISKNTINISTEAGRCVRPIYIVNPSNNKLLFDKKYILALKNKEITWKNLIADITINNTSDDKFESIIEYVDVEENNTLMIASMLNDLKKGNKGERLQLKYTHMEIHPSLILGVLASNIPFSNHNQAPRNTYQCLDPDEPVLLANGTRKRIGDVVVGDEVKSFCPKTLAYVNTKVVNQYVRETDKEIYTLSTISGRKITVTYDHKFMTDNGWMEMIDIYPNQSRVGVSFDPMVSWYESSSDIKILNQYVNEYTVDELEERLSPTHQTHSKYNNVILQDSRIRENLGTLAKIVGFVYTEGCVQYFINNCTPHVQFTCSTIESIEALMNDIALLGFGKRNILETSNETSYTTKYKVVYTGPFAFLLMLLDDVCEKNASQQMRVPAWIQSSSTHVQTEFVRGLYGANGGHIIYDEDMSVVKIEPLSLSCLPEYNNHLVEFMRFVENVLSKNNIHTGSIKITGFATENSIVSLELDESVDNVIAFFEVVAFPYDYKKNCVAGVVVEYMKTLKHTEQYITFKEFRNKIIVNTNSCFVPVELPIREFQKTTIADITVDVEHHSFIGGDNFMVHNSAMGKQAIGLYATNYKTRLDTLSHVLNYPQQPLVKTNMSTMLNLSNMPCGTNVIVAIATYTGYNQEDSIILNKSSVQRGLFTSTFYRTLKEQCNKNLSTGEEEIFCNPKNMESFVNKPQNYNKIDEDGFVSENIFVEAGDVLIGKCMPQKTSTNFFHKDNSITMKNNEIGYIDMSCTNDKYFKNTSADGYSFCKIKIRNFREPTIGDKLSSNHAQKGSIGIMYTQEDMPYTKDGLVPDIIINPHAIPSRMTIAQLIETIMGKACATMGTVGNATPFTSIGVNDICNILGNDCKLEPHGNQLMYNSRTGEQMKTSIFVGPTYYQRLKHMVCDKIHSRNSNGPVVLLTRQPAEGRARDGGLRLGEMEVECNWGHGTMNFLKERFIDCSDNYRIFTCKKCGNIANVNPNQNIYICNLCNNKTNFSEIRIPFASKLLFQEIQSMGINTKFYT
ncbi:hypothetical protein QKU58_gp091 [Pyramimonas orientalis virus]|uniref:DNA-directed RNA polymerase n=1 Tax=Pyramimonas orientalis virus 01B TaxID=3134525 RepID=A0A7L9AYH1_9VIRU|nr:hypothetical protein QKU58_gp091 [Pyramimonas orientalis virus]QOI90240.1 hypothetical protein HWQ62_00103 [Pyramimonas orientalis virus]